MVLGWISPAPATYALTDKLLAFGALVVVQCSFSHSLPDFQMSRTDLAAAWGLGENPCQTDVCSMHKPTFASITSRSYSFLEVRRLDAPRRHFSFRFYCSAIEQVIESRRYFLVDALELGQGGFCVPPLSPQHSLLVIFTCS